MTDIEANKALINRYFAALEEGDLTALDEIVATDYRDHVPGRKPGRGPLKTAVQALRVAFPDMTSTVTHLVAEGDLVAVRNRVTGTHRGPLGDLPATGNRVDFAALQLFRIRGDFVVAHWESFDESALARQLRA
jgi:predicted ester cyclase